MPREPKTTSRTAWRRCSAERGLEVSDGPRKLVDHDASAKAQRLQRRTGYVAAGAVAAPVNPKLMWVVRPHVKFPLGVGLHRAESVVG